MTPQSVIFLTLTLIVSVTHSCPHALDWEKQSAEERAGAAPIVVVGYVTRTYKDQADEKTTYAVDFKIIRALKGADAIAKLPHNDNIGSDIHRITNFGSMLMCFADLNQEHVYMLFLHVVNNHLSALYTDLFGAAEVWTMEMEDRVILENQGYEPWSEWTACSATCGDSGIQQRSRKCSRQPTGTCDDANTQKRKCNTIECAGVKDIVQLAGFDSMKKGVIALNITGRTIYDITPNFYGQVSTPTVFSPLWPEKFSVLGRIRPRKTKYPREGQYLISLTDSSGRLYLGLKAFPSPTLEILHKTGRMSSVSIPLPHDNINDGQWHQFGFGINGNNITMYYNCYARTVQILQSEPFIPNIYQSTMIIGSKMFAMDRGADERYEGALSQLVFTDDTEDVRRQCQPDTWSESVQQKAGSLPRQSAASVGAAQNYLDHWEWSTWSECSASCGFGVKVRKPFCLDDNINADDCIPYYVPRTHEKQCFGGRCPACDCDNGGSCVDDGVCECAPGWAGPTCKTAICEAGCNRGECIGPGICKCPSGWSGSSCDKAMCFPTCRNGGVCIGNNQCKCAEGFGGRFCTEHLMEHVCKKRCRNGGVCAGNNKCKCPEGWRGSRCHKPAPVCKGGCLNGGRCRKGNVCKCKKGFAGKNCESDVCGNCRNGGICKRKTKQCSCPEGFAGQLCQYEVKESLCAKNPCQNVGKCIAYDTCYCPSGWFGLRCEYRECLKYKMTLTSETIKVKKPEYKLIECDRAPHRRCRVQSGYKYEDRTIFKYTPDYSTCEENRENG